MRKADLIIKEGAEVAAKQVGKMALKEAAESQQQGSKILVKQGAKITFKGLFRFANAGGIVADIVQAGFEVGVEVTSRKHLKVGKGLKVTGKVVGAGGNAGAAALAGGAIGASGVAKPGPTRVSVSGKELNIVLS